MSSAKPVPVPLRRLLRWWRSGALAALLLAGCGVGAPGQSAPLDASPPPSTPIPALTASIREHMMYLAGDALQGRGSGSVSERAAAEYVAAQLRQYGVEPAGQDGGYIQQVELTLRSVAAPPELSFCDGDGDVVWTHGREILVTSLADVEISGPLQKIHAAAGSAPVPQPGAMVLLLAAKDSSASPWRQAWELLRRGAAVVLFPAPSSLRGQWKNLAKRLPEVSPKVGRSGQLPGMGGELTEVVLSDTAVKRLSDLPDGTPIRLRAQPEPSKKGLTWNGVGILRGSDPRLADQAILLSAHLDHLGVRPATKGGKIFHGADDDASGVSAVLELARVLAAGPRPRRTVIFAFFGSEERGGLGSTYFRSNPPVPLEHIVAALEFEMLGRPDKAILRDALWLTGYERSNLGPELAAHGAPLVADPHPREYFFERSDNYVLAKQGVVAHTVSSFGLHKDYHRPTDDLAHIDFAHLTEAIQSMIQPVRWLANSDFKPQWVEGGKP